MKVLTGTWAVVALVLRAEASSAVSLVLTVVVLKFFCECPATYCIIYYTIYICKFVYTKSEVYLTLSCFCLLEHRFGEIGNLGGRLKAAKSAL